MPSCLQGPAWFSLELREVLSSPGAVLSPWLPVTPLLRFCLIPFIWQEL